MKKPILVLFLLLPIWPLAAQQTAFETPYEPSAEHPFGLPNPQAPQEIRDFAPMIGRCDCKSLARNPDGTWADTVDMVWTFKYIMDGMAVQDETLKADGRHSGSIRQFNPDSSLWYVHYYNSARPLPVLPAWQGTRSDTSIVLFRPQKAPNGMDGYYRITFFGFSGSGYRWLGEWVDLNQKVRYPTWRIWCERSSNP